MQKRKCLSANGKGTWVTEGFRTLRKDRVQVYMSSEQHKEALKREVEINLEVKGYERNLATGNERLECIFAMTEIIRFIASHDLALSLFPSLVDQHQMR